MADVIPRDLRNLRRKMACSVACLAVFGGQLACAGKSSYAKQDRYIPEAKKTLYLADIVNYSDESGLSEAMYSNLQDHFQRSSLLRYVGNIPQSDVYLDIEILAYSRELFKRPPFGKYNVPLRLRLQLSFLDTESKAYYIKNKVVTVSHWYSKEGGVGRGSEDDEAQKILFDKVCRLLDELIKRGDLDSLKFQPY